MGETARGAGPGGRHRGVVLRTRLVPPQLPPYLLPREALVQRVRDGARGPVVALVAGAGYGKTTLLAQALSHREPPCVWLSCDERIGEPRALLAHLAIGIGERYPGVTSRLRLDGTVDEQVASLCNELLATVADDLVIAIDDLHTIEGSGGEDAVRLMIQGLPANIHVALASRTDPRIGLGRLRASGAVILDERALALDEDECARLVGALGTEADDPSVRDLRSRTEGWIAGVLLSAQSRASDGAAAPPTDASGDHFDYLAEEVLGREREEIDDFLCSTAVLERFTPELASAVSGHDSRPLLAEVMARHLFTVRLDGEGEWYRHHALFRRFLLRRIAASGRARVRDLHRRAARAWMAAGSPTEAARHLLEAGDHAEAADALEPVAEMLLMTPEADGLASDLSRIPEPIVSERPALLLANAALLVGRGEHEASFRAFERAIDQLLAAGEFERAASALFRLLAAVGATGTAPHVRGVADGERFISRFPPGTRGLPAARVMMAMTYGYASRYEDAERELEAALSSPAAEDMPALAAYATVNRAFVIDHFRGRSHEALAALAEAIAWLEAHRSEDALGYLAWAIAYRAIILGHLGRWQETLREAERWHGELERSGYRSVAVTASWPRFGALAALGRWDELRAEIERVAPIASGMPGTMFALRHAAAEAQLAVHDGDAGRVEQAITGVLGADHPSFFRSMVLGDLAAAALEVARPDAARIAASEARAAAIAGQALRAQARAAMLLAACAGEASDDALDESLELTDAGRYDEIWALRHRDLASPLLVRALVAGLGPPGAAARLAAACGAEVFTECARRLASAPARARRGLRDVMTQAAGIDLDVVEPLLRTARPRGRRSRDAGPPAAPVPARPPLELNVLGGLLVRRGDLPVPAGAFRRERAREVLAALICAGGPVHREQLLDWLWPALPRAGGLRALHVTLYELRRALEPGIERAADSVVAAEGETYRLALKDGDRVDLEEFLELGRPPLTTEPVAEAIERLRRAAAAYGGPLLPEWPYADWAARRRLEVERVHRDVLAGLAGLLLEAGQPQAAAVRFEELVALEPEREAWHRGLMRAYAASGDRGMALRQFHACRTTLREQLGVEPDVETRELYRDILGTVRAP